MKLANSNGNRQSVNSGKTYFKGMRIYSSFGNFINYKKQNERNVNTPSICFIQAEKICHKKDNKQQSSDVTNNSRLSAKGVDDEASRPSRCNLCLLFAVITSPVHPIIRPLHVITITLVGTLN